MNFLINIFNIVLYQPLFNILILFYQYLPGQDFGIAVIVLTILVRVLFYPLSAKSVRSQRVLQDLQPKMQEIQEKYKDNKQKQTEEIMKLYQEEKINPLSGCLPLLIQLPILIAFYQVISKGLVPGEMVNIYSFIPNPGKIDPTFLGWIDLSQPNIPLAVGAGILQFFQAKMTTPKTVQIEKKDRVDQFSKIFQKQTLYFFPVLTFLILLKLPSAIGFYWSVSILFSIFQQYIIFKNR